MAKMLEGSLRGGFLSVMEMCKEIGDIGCWVKSYRDIRRESSQVW